MPMRLQLEECPLVSEWGGFEKRLARNYLGTPIGRTLEGIGMLVEDICEAFFGSDIAKLAAGNVTPRIRKLLATLIVARGSILGEHVAILRRRIWLPKERRLENLLTAVAALMVSPERPVGAAEPVGPVGSVERDRLLVAA